jgi:hypothetical protein
VPDRYDYERLSADPAEGVALRELRVLLFEHDHFKVFGGLRRVHAPAGDFLWVCADHYRDYDPGLPDLSSRRLGPSAG